MSTSSDQLVWSKNTAETPTISLWHDFFDIRSFSIPSSLHDATTRLIRNISHFQVVYSSIILNICYQCIGFFVRPLSTSLFLVYVCTTLACYLAYAKVVASYFSLLHRSLLLGVVAVFTVIMFALAHDWYHFLIVFVISITVVCLHGLLKVPTFEYDGI